jgi:hypothetical protein
MVEDAAENKGDSMRLALFRIMTVLGLMASGGICQTPSWSVPGIPSDIQVYPGDGTASRPPVVKVGITETGEDFGWRIDTSRGQQMYQALLMAFQKGAKVRYWGNRYCVQACRQNYWYQNPIGTWVSTYTIVALDLIVQN